MDNTLVDRVCFVGIANLVGALEHVFSPYIGYVIIPTDELIFFRGVQTTNQIYIH